MDQMIGKHIVRLQKTDSTNNYANGQLSQYELTEGTVFLTYEQSAGRGQMKNFWESEPGKNLTFSIAVFPDFLEVRHQFMISKVVTLGIYRALSKYVDKLRIKWPNDIYVGDKKLGGILIENSIMYNLIKSSVIGIGININQTIFHSNAPNPVSLKILTNQYFDCNLVLSEILSGIDYYYSLLKKGEKARIDLEFISVMYRLNEKHWFRTEKEEFEGEIIGVNEIGQLLVSNQWGKTYVFHFKEVEFLQQINE
jgi:BirA family transcriptional regulator, biotin operon repressor / biotin---[acetyl-CoA-carboxylase] ligase